MKGSDSMILYDLIKRCKTRYNSITIIDSESGAGILCKDMKSIPEDLHCCKIICFDSGFQYDASYGFIFGLKIVLRRFPKEKGGETND